MPIALVRGVKIYYRVFGDTGPWLALTPGGRRSFDEFVDLAEAISQDGFRVLLHDRRNCGRSEISFDGSDAEDAIWAEDLYALLESLGALPAFVGGSSSGCRMSLLFYLRHRNAVRGLLLLRVTGGAYAATVLPEKYYEVQLRALREGGMAAVACTDHWQERLANIPEDRSVLVKTPKARFTTVMASWRDQFVAGVDLPVLGITEAELESIAVPTIVVPGNDLIHSGAVGRRAQSLIPGAILHELPAEQSDRDLIPFEEWKPFESEIAIAFGSLMRSACWPEPRLEDARVI